MTDQIIEDVHQISRLGSVAAALWSQAESRRVADELSVVGVPALMLKGPDLVGAIALQEGSGAGVLVQGGVGSLDDLIRAKASVLAGVVMGRALYEGRFTLAEAFTAMLDH